MREGVATWLPSMLLALTAVSCAPHTQIEPQDSADRLGARVGATPRVSGAIAPEIPQAIRVDDGLTADEAVAIALWNNAEFQVSVSELGFARADLLEAGLLANPVLSLLFPVGPKQLEATLRLPIELLWQRPRRVAAARLSSEAAAEQLVQAGLNLVLAVRVSYIDLSLAVDRNRLADEAATLLSRIDTMTQSRLSAGDISQLEARASQVDAARGADDARRAGHDVTIAQERLRLLLGLPVDWAMPPLAASQAPAAECRTPSDLLREALAARPDLRAAEIAVEAAAAKLGWERSRVLSLTAVLDANGEGREGFEAGPGIDLGLPLFNRNQAGRARAGAELQRASALYVAIQRRVALELHEASAQLEQARQSGAAWRETITAPLQANLTQAQNAFEGGEVSLIFVLDYTRRLADARLRERELAADQQRARARIERALGRSCGAPIQETPRDR